MKNMIQHHQSKPECDILFVRKTMPQLTDMPRLRLFGSGQTACCVQLNVARKKNQTQSQNFMA